MNINIQVIENDQHRKPFGGGTITGADWYFDEKGDLQVRVSKMSDWRYETALALHEMVEALICRHMNINQNEVDVFDVEYDKTHNSSNNAGDDPAAPYAVPHTFATAAERIFTGATGVNWEIYDRELEAL